MSTKNEFPEDSAKRIRNPPNVNPTSPREQYMHLIFKEGFSKGSDVFQFFIRLKLFYQIVYFNFDIKAGSMSDTRKQNVRLHRDHMSFTYVYEIKTGGTGVVWATVFNIVKSKMSNRKNKRVRGGVNLDVATSHCPIVL